MTETPDMDPADVAAMDAAFESGIAEAMKRGTCLLMMRSQLTGRSIWACLYPPGETTGATVGAWAQQTGIQPKEGDLFIDLPSVHRAAADLGVR